MIKKIYLMFVLFFSITSYSLPNNNLLVYLPFEDNIYDYSENNRSTSLYATDGPDYSFADGKVGRCLTFTVDGTANSGDFVTIPDFENADGTVNFSISVWIKRTDIRGDYPGYPVYKINSYNIGIDSNSSAEITGYFYDNDDTHYLADTLTTSDSAAENTDWHHVVITHDGIIRKLYVDNLLINSITDEEWWSGTLANNNNDIGIGYGIKALIDEVRIYNTVLSEDDIEELYNQENVPPTPYPTLTPVPEATATATMKRPKWRRWLPTSVPGAVLRNTPVPVTPPTIPFRWR